MNLAGLGQTSMLHGWLPWTIQLLTAVVVLTTIAQRPRRWWLRSLPAVTGLAVLSAVVVRWYLSSEGLVGDPAPWLFWAWTGLSGASVGVLLLGWRNGSWGRRGMTVVAVPLCVLCTVLLLNIWVGYARTTQAAWNFLTAGPPPNQAELTVVRAMAGHGVVPQRGRIVPIDTGQEASGFQHRGELVYLPPAWFSSSPPPPLPVVLMIGGELGTSADWIWAGNAQQTADAFAAAHGGNAPVLVFVDKGGTFTRDTECVNGARGNAADHLLKDVVPYVISTFGVGFGRSGWGVVGWSMGGTCAVDLAVMHPERFSAFIDIDGDLGPNAGTREQSIARLFNGDADAWASFDPLTVMTRHGPYQDVAGVFGVEAADGTGRVDQHAVAARMLSEAAATNGIECSLLEVAGKHDWAAGAAVLSATFDWLAGRLGTPGIASVPLPGAIVERANRSTERLSDRLPDQWPTASPPTMTAGR